ncbi:MAG: glycoside hydrolase family 43 protein [Ruminococcaceae bacterium]|nr:glycoside hydrolase family 43 protein [Oscillospiraceae bacterium]
MKYKNPIIKGFNPDPSICRVGEDFYLVTSTFEFFPGVPVYHSKNLVNWELVNYCLTKDSQLPLEGARSSDGIYAPTIRYYNGTFFMTTTNVSYGGNFIVHTNDVYGEWSEPAYADQGGIDPSLFWDDDGTCYFVSNGLDENGRVSIFLCTIDPFTGKKYTETTLISYGCGGRYPEAPHIYKKNGYYYLMLAEGGTEYGHMETIQRSKNIWGPYEACPHNPILTHRDTPGPIQATGHADLVEDQNGNWHLVCLAIRPIKGMQLHHLGRESFLAPVIWDENGWPHVGNNGKIDFEMEGHLPGPVPQPVSSDFCDSFDGEKLNLKWSFVRNPRKENYILENGHIVLKGGDDCLSTPFGHPTMIALRQEEFDVEFTTELNGEIDEGQRSGLSAFYNSDYHYDIFITKEGGAHFVCLGKRVADIDVVVKSCPIDYNGSARLKIEANDEWYKFFYERNGEFVELGKGATTLLCTETNGRSFTGTFLGVFTENGKINVKSVISKEL